MRPVVLVHGFLVGGYSFKVLANRLRRRGFQPHLFAYPSRQITLEQAARQLLDFSHRLDPQTLDWVGHSLGGLVILEMFKQLEREQSVLPPGRLVLLGSPVRGAGAALGLSQHRWGRRLLGQARMGLQREFDRAPKGRETTVIAGTQPVGMGQWFHPIASPHDGTVSCAETKLTGARWLSVHTTHSGLLFSSQVADETIRALSGHFDQ